MLRGQEPGPEELGPSPPAGGAGRLLQIPIKAPIHHYGWSRGQAGWGRGGTGTYTHPEPGQVIGWSEIGTLALGGEVPTTQYLGSGYPLPLTSSQLRCLSWKLWFSLFTIPALWGWLSLQFICGASRICQYTKSLNWVLSVHCPQAAPRATSIAKCCVYWSVNTEEYSF